MNQVSVVAEMERMAYSFEWAGENEIKCVCPFHDDTSPSCHINVEKRVFKCQAATCHAEGDFVSFVAKYLGTQRAIVIEDFTIRYELETSKTIPIETVERYHTYIWEAKPLLAELYKRGVTDKIIRQRRLGIKEGRITIPVFNENNFCVNVRRYLPGAPGAQKMKNEKGYGQPRLYPIDQLKFHKLLLCGGEMKALVAAEQLNAHGIGAICVTSGEGNWDVSLTPKLRGKEVVMCFDVDKGGEDAYDVVGAQIFGVVESLGVARLPLDLDRYPKGDINDFVATEHGNMLDVWKSAVQWEARSINELDWSEPVEVSLSQAINASMVGKRVKLEAVVMAMDTSPYSIPRTVVPHCARDQAVCALCSVFTKPEKDRPYTIHPESPSIIEMIGGHKDFQSERIKSGIGIPKGCKTVEFDIHDYYHVEDTRITPQLDVTDRTLEARPQPALCISPEGSQGLELNEGYVLTGRMHPHPRTQQSTLMISSYDTTHDALSTYDTSNMDLLEKFQPSEWSLNGVAARLNDIYEDFETNVTRIIKRREIHLTTDLAYHSPLLLSFDGRNNVKGWVETLILGDSANGKSEVVCGSDGRGGLKTHYGLGYSVSCKNASVAGLVGGVQQLGNRHFVTWGIIPTHDRRLVIMEEFKGASTEIIAKMTDMRSSGVAEIPKIEKRRTMARTRLIAISNARGDRALGSYSFGVEAIKELVGSLEDIRRFDMATIVTSGDVSAEEINRWQRSRPQVNHVYDSESCRSLVLWGWTRKSNEIAFDDNAYDAILELATAMCQKYTDAIPLVDRGSMRLKLARLAASLAVRTFSVGATLDQVRVRDCHVEYIHQFLDQMYSRHSFGYLDYSEAVRINEELVDPTAVLKQINDTPFPRDFVKMMLRAPVVDLADLQDWTGWDRQGASDMMSFLVRKHALKRIGRHYAKTPPFIQLLKRALEDNGSIVDRPDHIPEKNERF